MDKSIKSSNNNNKNNKTYKIKTDNNCLLRKLWWSSPALCVPSHSALFLLRLLASFLCCLFASLKIKFYGCHFSNNSFLSCDVWFFSSSISFSFQRFFLLLCTFTFIQFFSRNTLHVAIFLQHFEKDFMSFLSSLIVSHISN